jgi:hypothetical protein
MIRLRIALSVAAAIMWVLAYRRVTRDIRSVALERANSP